MKKRKKFLSLFVTLTMVMSILFSNYAVVGANAQTVDLNTERIKTIRALQSKDLERTAAQNMGQTLVDDAKINKTSTSVNQVSPDDQTRIIVELEAASTYEMGKKKGISFQESLKLTNSVKEQQAPIISQAKAYGAIKHTYQNLLNGFSATVKYKDISAIREISGVKNVTVANVYELDMNAAAKLTNATTVWEELALKGEGTVVSVIDTGTDYTHKDMRLTDATKAKLSQADVSTLGGPGHFYTNKVPYGYNYADMNDNIIPKATNEHGMHVSGIVGANGTDAEINADPTSAIKGVAPEAQIIGFKVFSDNPILEGGAFSDDIAAAIEDSVKHGADVINMSLGSTASFVNIDDPEQLAIKNATDEGTIVVVSGGNSYYSSYYLGGSAAQDPDMGLVGSPGLFPDTIQVASYENTNVSVCKLNSYVDGTLKAIGYQKQPTPDAVTVFGNKKMEAVYIGNGMPAKYTMDVKDKLVLVFRDKDLPAGTSSFNFQQIKDTATAKGAAGVIIRGRNDHGDYVNMALGTTPNLIPMVSLSLKDADSLIAAASAGKKIEFTFTNDFVSVDNADTKRMSDFSSWGPSPDFGFKPEISAPGGNIWSTIPDNKYENMSGTSMASPHAAGAMALVVQGLRKSNATEQKRDFVSLAKKLIINSCEPIFDMDSELPYLTRKQGAGLIKIDKAITTKAYVTDTKDSATISLKNIGNTTSFDLKIKNFGDKVLEFAPKNNWGVLTSYVNEGTIIPYTDVIQGATTEFSKTKITVAPGATETFTVTLNIPATAAKDIFAEGFLTLESVGANANPSLGIPFMAFYGNWDNPRVFDAPFWDSTSQYGNTNLISTFGGELDYLGLTATGTFSSSNNLAISPDGDDYQDIVMPYVNLLRNAKELKVQVLDKDYSLLRTISVDKNMKKTYYSGNTGRPTSPNYKDAWAWDGTVYNPKTGNYDMMPNGQYYIRLSGLVDGGVKPSILDLPVKIDTQVPELAVTTQLIDGKHFKFNINGSDYSGISNYYIFINGDMKSPKILSGAAKEYIYPITDAIYSFDVYAQDFAGNVTYQNILVNNLLLIPSHGTGFHQQTYGLYADPNITYGYILAEALKSSVDHYNVTLDGAVINNGLKEEISYKDLSDGTHSIIVDAIGKDGKVISEVIESFIVDTKVPVITMTAPTSSTTDLTNGEKQYTVKFNIKDASVYSLYLNGTLAEKIPGNVITGKNYSYIVDIPNDGIVKVKAVDVTGKTAETVLTFNIGYTVPKVHITSPTNGDVVFGKSVNVAGLVDYTTIAGVAVKVNTKAATLAENKTFTSIIDFVKYGQNIIKVEAEDGLKIATPATVTIINKAIKFDKNSYVTSAIPVEGKYPAVTIGYELNVDATIDHVNITTEGGIAINNAATKTSVAIPTDNLKKGQNIVVFEVCDASNNVLDMSQVIILVDKDGATIDVPALNEMPTIDKTTLAITGIASRPLETLVVKTGGATGEATTVQGITLNNVNHMSITGTLVGLIDGLNRVEFTMTDTLGNVTKYDYKLYVDMEAPELIITSPAAITAPVVVTDKTYTLKMSAKDNGGGYRLYVNDNQVGFAESETGNGFGTDKSFEYTIDVPGGTSTFVVKVVDFVGFETSQTITFQRNSDSAFNVSATNPTMNFVTPEDIIVKVEPNTKELKSIKNGTNLLIKDTDYIVGSDTVTILADYIKKLPIGDANLTFEFTTSTAGQMTTTVNLKLVDSRSTDTALATIKINNFIVKDFNPSTLNYVYPVSEATYGIPQVTAEAVDSKTLVKVAQAQEVPGMATITVTAENGTVKVYTVNFTQEIKVTKVSTETSFKVGNDAKLTLNVANLSNVEIQATLIMGLFTTDGEMLYYVSANQAIGAGKNVNLNGTMSIPTKLVDGKTCVIRYFVWDSIFGQKPLSKMGTIQVTE